MANNSYVIDASVVVKWFLNDEEHIDIATRVLEEFLSKNITLHAPDILTYELGGMLVKATRQGGGRITDEEAEESLSDFLQLPIEFHKLEEPASNRVIKSACKYRRGGFNDYVYIDMAIELGCSWLTDDRKFRSPLPEDFPVSNILLLESFS
ncbi:MAG: PIN domain-containing protein [Planctomycetota bacterium]|nr:MAG: PIN domain-containing protein [Planctomycetota bacterium]